jgi:hypothetical protein
MIAQNRRLTRLNWLHITLSSFVFFAFYTPLLGQNLSNPGLLNHLYKFCNKEHFIFIETYVSPRIENAHNIGRCLNVMGDTIGAVTNNTLAHSSSYVVEGDGIILFWGLQRNIQEYCKWNCLHVKKASADNKWAEMEWFLDYMPWRISRQNGANDVKKT